MPGRHHEVSRIEAFSDAVFGFALTLLVVSLDVPRDPAAFRELVRGSVLFALMFAMVCYIWWEHNKFFRRYGLQDAWTAFLNSMLLFVVLFYVYPLKYLTTSLLGPAFNLSNSPEMADPHYLMLVYSTGVVLIFGTFVLLYRHAWRQRTALGLKTADELTLRFGLRAHVISMLLGVSSIVLTLIVPDRLMYIPGFIYALMGPLHGWNGYKAGAALAKHDKSRAAPEARDA